MNPALLCVCSFFVASSLAYMGYFTEGTEDTESTERRKKKNSISVFAFDLGGISEAREASLRPEVPWSASLPWDDALREMKAR